MRSDVWPTTECVQRLDRSRATVAPPARRRRRLVIQFTIGISLSVLAVALWVPRASPPASSIDVGSIPNAPATAATTTVPGSTTIGPAGAYGIFKLDSGIEKPKVLHRVRPNYTARRARSGRIYGPCASRRSSSPGGTVGEVRVIPSLDRKGRPRRRSGEGRKTVRGSSPGEGTEGPWLVPGDARVDVHAERVKRSRLRSGTCRLGLKPSAAECPPHGRARHSPSLSSGARDIIGPLQTGLTRLYRSGASSSIARRPTVAFAGPIASATACNLEVSLALRGE